MSCTSPRKAWPKPGGGYVFNAARSYAGAIPVELPCGQCTQCRARRASEWATRLMHEAQLHERSCFLTLTYAGDHLPPNGDLVKRDVQLFLKRLRFQLAERGIRVRYFAAGEYGDRRGRPHYHIILWGYDFAEDRKPLRRSAGKHMAYKSEELSALWGKGFAELGTVTEQSCNYVARYIVKKQNGERADEAYGRWCELTGERIRLSAPWVIMSTRPGIGAGWFEKFGHTDAFPGGKQSFVIVDGKRRQVPRYYWKLFKKTASGLDVLRIEAERKKHGREVAHDNTPERRAVKAESLALRLKRAVRVLDEEE